MNLLRSRLFLGILCFTLGAAAVLVVQKLSQRPKDYPFDLLLSQGQTPDPFFDLTLNDDTFGNSQEMMKEMHRLKEQMMKMSEEDGQSLFETWFKKRVNSGTVSNIIEREDQDFISYEIAINGLKQEKVNVSIENGQLRISGQVEQKMQSGSSNSFYSSSFHRSFPVPENVDADKVQVTQEKNKVIVKFPKVHSGS